MAARRKAALDSDHDRRSVGAGPLAAIYVRQSRTDDSKKDKQKREHAVETTLDTQAAACKREAVKRGFVLDSESVYSERYTGAEMWDRPVLSELRRRIKERAYGALFVYSTDRLARDPIHLALILEECQRANCELVFVTEPLEDSPEGELILYIKGYAAKIERLRIKDRMARGRNAIIAAGKLTCQGNAPYGYQFDPANRVRVIDPATAPTVQDIFRWTVEGMSARQIKDRLISMRIPCPAEHHGKQFKAGKPIWNISAVARILADETYTGITFVNKTKVTDVRVKATGKHVSEIRPKNEWKRLPDGVTPAIITREVFDAARLQVIAHRRKSDYSRNSLRPVLLRGLVFCGECGCAMWPMSESTHKPANPLRSVYKCSAKRRKPSDNHSRREAVCSAKRVIAAELEDRVWAKLVTFIVAPELVETEVERVLSSAPDSTMTSDLDGVKKQLIAAKRLRDAALDKYEDAVADDDRELQDRWDRKAKSASDDIRALSAVQKQLESKLAAFTHRGRSAKAFAKKVRAVLSLRPEDYTFEEKRAALEALAVRVYDCVCHATRIELNTGILEGTQQEQNVAIEVRA